MTPLSEGDIAAIDWIDLMVAVAMGGACELLKLPANPEAGPIIPTQSRAGAVRPELRPLLDHLLTLPDREAESRVADAMVAWRIKHDGLKGWRMGADGRWDQSPDHL